LEAIRVALRRATPGLDVETKGSSQRRIEPVAGDSGGTQRGGRPLNNSARSLRKDDADANVKGVSVLERECMVRK
jgi:hypothetical protein